MGIGISVVSSIRQYRETRSFTYDFAELDWKPLGGDQSVVETSKSDHKKDSSPASTTVYRPTDSGGYQEVTCGGM